MNWTTEQNEAIQIRDKSILVSAAAGSGKTAVLVERIKQILLEEKISLDEILVLTFTNAAASEMKEKIVNALPEQIELIQNSHIGTFHAFALDIIGRYFHLIDLEPGFSVCDDERRILLQNEAMDQLFEKHFENDDPDFLYFLKMYGTSRSEDSVKQMIGMVYNFILSMAEPFAWLEQKVEELQFTEAGFQESPVYDELIAYIERSLAGIADNLTRVHDMLRSRGLTGLQLKAERDLSGIIRIQKTFAESYEAGRQLMETFAFEKFSASGDEKELYEPIKESVAFLRDRAKAAFKNLKKTSVYGSLEFYAEEIAATKKVAEILRALVIDFHSIYSGKKREKALLDFSDIEHFALEILSHEEAAGEYREKFKFIFVDEYQDSNLVQEALIRKIQKPDNLFMVGDVKQSIYKFRLAEPEIFIKKYQKLKENADPDGIKLDLNKNFRSKAPIIDGVNQLFGFLMNEDTAGMDYDDAAALYKGVPYEGPLEHDLEFHLVDYEKDSDDDLSRVESEAMLVASLIKRNRGLPYFDVKAGEEKKLDYKDMVILLRSAAGSADKYKEALELHGIPAFVDTGDGYFDSLEVSVFLNLLKVIDNKRQDLPLLSVLRSAIFDLSIEEMADIRGSSPATSFAEAFFDYAEAGGSEELKMKCVQILNKIARWNRQRKYSALKDFVWTLMMETDFYYYVGALPGGKQRQANLRALADKALAYESSQGKGLFGFTNYIEAVRERKIATAPVNLLGEGDNVVRIMTVHKSKGLEFPFVILAGLGKQLYREGGQRISLHKDLGLGLRYVDESLAYYRKTILQKLIDSRIRREALAEEIRILYVAMTRAQDKLILVGNDKNPDRLLEKALLTGRSGIGESKSYLEMILSALGVTNEANAKSIKDIVIHKSRDLAVDESDKSKEVQTEFTENPEMAALVKNRFEWSYPFMEATKNKGKYSVSELNKRGLKTRRHVGVSADSKATNRGKAYHTVLEHLPLDKLLVSEDDVKGYLDSLVADNILSKEMADLISMEKIMRFTESSLFKRMQKSGEIFRESPFNLVKEIDGEKVMVQGIIDAYFKEDNEYVLVDYKTDYDDGSPERETSVRETYGLQLELYKEALEKVGKLKVKEAYLYLVSSDRYLKIL